MMRSWSTSIVFYIHVMAAFFASLGADESSDRLLASCISRGISSLPIRCNSRLTPGGSIENTLLPQTTCCPPRSQNRSPSRALKMILLSPHIKCHDEDNSILSAKRVVTTR